MSEAGELRLAVPAEPKSVWTARLFAAAAARHLRFDEDIVEDIRLAASEAVTAAVQSHARRRTTGDIGIVFRFDSGGVWFEVEDRASGGHPEMIDDANVSIAVIGSLFPGVESSETPDGLHVVRVLLDRRSGASADDDPANETARRTGAP